MSETQEDKNNPRYMGDVRGRHYWWRPMVKDKLEEKRNNNRRRTSRDWESE